MSAASQTPSCLRLLLEAVNAYDHSSCAEVRVRGTFEAYCAAMNRALLLLVALSFASHHASAAAPRKLYVKARHIFDGTGPGHRDNGAVLIDGDRIAAVGSIAELPVPPGAEVIDLGDATLLPGLIDCHVHLSSRADEYDPILRFRHSPRRIRRWRRECRPRGRARA